MKSALLLVLVSHPLDMNDPSSLRKALLSCGISFRVLAQLMLIIFSFREVPPNMQLSELVQSNWDTTAAWATDQLRNSIGLENADLQRHAQNSPYP
jgi:hypothetical protein